MVRSRWSEADGPKPRAETEVRSPYLGSPTWHRGRSVLKIIALMSSLLTNIIQALGKHNMVRSRGPKPRRKSRGRNWELAKEAVPLYKKQ